LSTLSDFSLSLSTKICILGRFFLLAYPKGRNHILANLNSRRKSFFS